MKNIFIISILFVNGLAYSQIKTNLIVNEATINTQTAFLDASSSTVWNGSTNNGKGLVFPRTGLVSMTTLNATPNGIGTSYPTRLDGMIVYNTETGEAKTGIAGVMVTPGFYYYENKTTTLNGGTWKPFTAAPVSPVVNVASTETTTNLQVAGAQVYARKGTFTTTGTTTAITLPTLGSAASLYSITIFKKSPTGNGAKIVYAKDLYSYDPSTGAAVTGSPNISVVYPQDTYDYVMEYMKN